MSIRNIQAVEPQAFGTYEPTLNCKGPFLALECGRDSLTCAKCFHIRNMSVKESVVLYYGNLLDHVDNIVKRYTSVKHSKSTCGITAFSYQVQQNLSNADDFTEDLMDFFRFRRDEMVADREIQQKQIYTNSFATSVIFPSNETRRYNVYGGDEGVSIEKNILKVTNLDKAFESGKYMYIINYYQFLDMINECENVMKMF